MQRGGQRGFPRGRFPGAESRRFPRRFPIRRRFPKQIVFPFFFGFPLDRCYYIDQYGRCCDRYGRCCDRYGRCVYAGGYSYPYAIAASADNWYGIEGGWDMMPDMDDMDDTEDMGIMAVYNEMSDYYDNE
jgi:hypothetical protein